MIVCTSRTLSQAFQDAEKPVDALTNKNCNLQSEVQLATLLKCQMAPK